MKETIKPPLKIQKSTLINRPKREVSAFLSVQPNRTLSGNEVCYRLQSGHIGQIFLHEFDSGTRTVLILRVTRDSTLRKLGRFVRFKSALSGHILEDEIRTVKSLLETGEVAKIIGQPHGARSMLGKLARIMLVNWRKGPQSLSKSVQPALPDQDERTNKRGGYLHEGVMLAGS